MAPQKELYGFQSFVMEGRKGKGKAHPRTGNEDPEGE